MRNPLANIAASPKESLMVRPVAANVVRISPFRKSPLVQLQPDML
jgi:hypothetical protein